MPAGDIAGAVAALEEVLADRMWVLGPDHSDTVMTRTVVDYWRGWSARQEGKDGGCVGIGRS